MVHSHVHYQKMKKEKHLIALLTNNDDDIVFYTTVLLTNTTQENRYVFIKGDFEKEYEVGMIETQVLSGCDTETGFKTFLVQDWIENDELLNGQ